LKDETYGEFKAPRTINSRSDQCKVLFGPFFHAIETKLFKLKWFIKYVPVKQRAQFISNYVNQPGAKIISTDFSQFEAHFKREIMETIEFQLYDYMVQNVPGGIEFMQLVRKYIGGTNDIAFKNINVYCDATRMSGEMNTSLGNSFTNLMIMLFSAQELGWISTKGTVEGDDGLFTYFGDLPPENWFNNLGWNIKLVPSDKISTASFCGLLFDEIDQQIITDPIKVVNNMGWLSRDYCHASDRLIKRILKCKSLSFLYQYSGCPIVHSLAKYFLRATNSSRTKMPNDWANNSYDRNYYIKILAELKDNWDLYINETPTYRTRLLFEQMYKITVPQQVAIEKYFDSLNELTPLNSPLLEPLTTVHTVTYHLYYVKKFSKAQIYDPYLNVYNRYENFKTFVINKQFSGEPNLPEYNFIKDAVM